MIYIDNLALIMRLEKKDHLMDKRGRLPLKRRGMQMLAAGFIVMVKGHNNG